MEETELVKESPEKDNTDQAEKDFFKNTAKYLDSIQQPVMVVDPEFKIIYMNEYGAKLLNSTPQDRKGQKCYDQFQTGDCNTSKCACGIAMKEKKDATSKTMAYPAGLELPIQYTAAPLFDEKGEVTGAVEVVTNITDLKQAMETISTIMIAATSVSKDVEGYAAEVLKTAENVGS